MQEIWKDIKGFEGYYQISNLGNVKSLGIYNKNQYKYEHLKKKRISNKGYCYVYICYKSKFKILTIHRLVAQAFIPNPFNKPCVNHIDGNKLNNIVTNLEWVTIRENNIHAYKTGLFTKECLINRNKKIGIKNSKPVIQYDKNMNYINEFKSVREAQDTTKIYGISSVLKGKRNNAKGYFWKYK